MHVVEKLIFTTLTTFIIFRFQKVFFSKVFPNMHHGLLPKIERFNKATTAWNKVGAAASTASTGKLTKFSYSSLINFWSWRHRIKASFFGGKFKNVKNLFWGFLLSNFTHWKCEFCGILRFWKCEFCGILDFENVNFLEF